MKQEKIKSFLPAVFQRTVPDTKNGAELTVKNPLAALLDVMEKLHEPAEQILENVERFFDPRRTPDAFVPFLAHWVNLDRIFPATEEIDLNSPLMPKIGHLRELAASATYLAQWRGTKKGLLLFLQTATGVKNFEIDERVKDSGEERARRTNFLEAGQQAADTETRIRPFHLKIRAPEEIRGQEALIRRIIESEKPVHMTYELEFF
ncbi:MAG TPA: phage tail protein [Pyrinomonadaceae bacterium]|nr:phage tail protein [Pyrinomonadaceae bacterium]